MITDLLGTKQRFNEPGLSGEYNWSQRLSEPILDYALDIQYANKISYLSKCIQEAGRAPALAAQVAK
jgi:4-alpha-glucanotransferase